MSEATTNGFSINGNQHSYSDAYVNKKDTANVNGNDSWITTAARPLFPMECQGIETALSKTYVAAGFALNSIFAVVSC